MSDSLAADGGQGRDRATSDLVEGFSNLNLLRQVGLMLGLAASVAIGFASVLWVWGDDYRPLYGSLDRLDSAEVVDVLDTNNITYKIDTSTGALLVAADDIHQARLKLAEVGIPGDQSAGFELLDQEQPLGTSQFMETARYRRSLEGELAKTITSINSVRSARVHLAIPKSSVFVRDTREPTASVFVELYPGRAIKPEQVRAMANLVASSIPELRLKNVTVVDQKGNLLSHGILEESEELLLAGKQREYTRKLEDDITRRINSILEPIVGMGRYKAEVSANVDFTEVEQAAESYNPDLPAVRSEQTLDEQRLGNDQAMGIPGALTNQPGGNGQAPEQANAQGGGEGAAAQPSNTRKQTTRNYELDRTISYTKHQQGKLRRLTVAVVVDDRVSTDAEGNEVRVPWSDIELERMSILVRDAVGYNVTRGDSVNVINSPFVDREAIPESEPVPLWEQPWVLAWIKPVAAFLIVLILLIGFVRPVMKSLASAGLRAKEAEEARELAALEAAGLDAFDSLSDDSVTLSGAGALALPGPEAGYEQQLNTIKGLVAEDAGRVALVVKGWVNQDD